MPAEESPGIPEWEVLDIPEDDEAEPNDAGHGGEDDAGRE